MFKCWDKVVATLDNVLQYSFNVGLWRCINFVQQWKREIGFCFIFNVGSTLFQRWSTTLRQHWSSVEVLPRSYVITETGSIVYLKRINELDNVRSDFVSFSTLDQLYFNVDPLRWDNTDLALKYCLGVMWLQKPAVLYIWKESMNLTRTLPKAKFILKNMIICSLCRFFVTFGEMLLMKRIFCYWFETSKIQESCNIVNMFEMFSVFKMLRKMLSSTFQLLTFF